MKSFSVIAAVALTACASVRADTAPPIDWSMFDDPAYVSRCASFLTGYPEKRPLPTVYFTDTPIVVANANVIGAKSKTGQRVAVGVYSESFNAIMVYKDPADSDEWRVTLVHEYAHWLGEDDEALAERAGVNAYVCQMFMPPLRKELTK